MRGPGLDLKTAIARRMADQAPFGVWTPVDFIDLGTRDAVDQALHRLTHAGDIRRIARGLYDKPGLNALTAKATNPDPRAVVDALARRDKYRMIVDGITAANDLGLSDAVPARIVVHTDARLKPLELGNLRIVFRQLLERQRRGGPGDLEDDLRQLPHRELVRVADVRGVRIAVHEQAIDPFHLVFHGGSGSLPQEISDAVDYGVVKMNVDTDTQYAFTRPVAGHMFSNYDGVLKIDGEVGDKKTYDPRSYLKKAEASMSERVVEACNDLKSAGKSISAS